MFPLLRSNVDPDIVNEELSAIKTEIGKTINKINDEVIKIKLEEIRKNINPLSNKDKINDSNLVNLMQYYDLVHELKSL